MIGLIVFCLISTDYPLLLFLGESYCGAAHWALCIPAKQLFLQPARCHIRRWWYYFKRTGFYMYNYILCILNISADHFALVESN